MGAHLIDGEFQSDKYPTTPRGKVPLSVKDRTAQDLLWEYAQRRREVDAEFSSDLEAALLLAGYKPRGGGIPAEVLAAARREPFIHLRRKDEPFRTPIWCDDRIVGFCHPHETPHGYRLGPIFVLPEYRGRGLTRRAYIEHASGKTCIAYIHHGNVGSEKAHRAAMFTLFRRGKHGNTWIRRMKILGPAERVIMKDCHDGPAPLSDRALELAQGLVVWGFLAPLADVAGAFALTDQGRKRMGLG